MKRILIIGLLLTSACSMAEHYTPVVDLQGRDEDRYQYILAGCRAKAAEVDVIGDSLTGVAIGGIGGAALGAVLGSVGGNVGGATAAVAAVGGAAHGATIYQNAQQRQITIMNNCLKARGFNVLG